MKILVFKYYIFFKIHFIRDCCYLSMCTLKSTHNQYIEEINASLLGRAPTLQFGIVELGELTETSLRPVDVRQTFSRGISETRASANRSALIRGWAHA